MQLRGALRSKDCSRCGRILRFFHWKKRNDGGAFFCLPCYEASFENKVQNKRHFKEQMASEGRDKIENRIKVEYPIVKRTSKTYAAKRVGLKKNAQTRSRTAVRRDDILIISENNGNRNSLYDWEREKDKNLIRRPQ